MKLCIRKVKDRRREIKYVNRPELNFLIMLTSDR